MKKEKGSNLYIQTFGIGLGPRRSWLIFILNIPLKMFFPFPISMKKLKDNKKLHWKQDHLTYNAPIFCMEHHWLLTIKKSWISTLEIRILYTKKRAVFTAIGGFREAKMVTEKGQSELSYFKRSLKGSRHLLDPKCPF